MIISEIAKLLGAEILCGAERVDLEIHCACGSDMMSDVLAFTKHDAILLTGLCNINTIRTADMVDIRCIMFVRGKRPPQDLIDMADEMGIVLLSTDHPMFTACGMLYESGIKGGMRGA